MSISSISSVSTPSPVKPPETSEAKAPEAKPETNSDNTYQPPAQAPLPPGQGTRIDQLV